MGLYRFGAFEFDVDAFVLRRGEEVLALQPKVLDVLRYLLERQGCMVTKSELLDQLWSGVHVNEAVVTWSVSHIRRALGQQPADKSPIETVHGRGYRFTGAVEAIGGPLAALPATEVRAAPGVADPRAAAFVGRERVMTELMQCVREAATGQGKLCVITGESGIGKTRCADELARDATELGLRTLIGRCPQASGTPALWPIDAALSRADDAIAARARELIVSLVEPETRSEGAQFRVIEQVALLLHELATARPTLLVLDDIHWADPSTLQLLGFISHELRAMPLCIVVTLRDSEREQDSPRDRLLQQALRYARMIPLASLESAQVADLMLAICRHRPSSELSDAVRRASGGVPLFVQEVVRALVRDHGEEGLEQLQPDAVRIPELARDVLRQRMHQLPKHTLAVLSRAAIIGDTFELALLAPLTELEPEALLDQLAPAVADEQLASDAPHTYRFAHSLYRSVLYDDLGPGPRVAAHRKLADLLNARLDRESRTGEIARHSYLSLPAGNHEEVTRRCREAGSAAALAFMFEDAALYFTWALEAQVFAGVAEPRVRAELLLSLASAQRSGGRTADATETAARVIELAQQHRMHDLIVGATRMRRPTMTMATIPDRLTRSALELVLRHRPEAADPVCIRALAQLACVPPYERDLASSKALSARAVALAEQQPDREVLFEALRARLYSLSGPDDIDGALGVADRMLTLERTGPRSWQAMDARIARWNALVYAGRIAEADGALAETTAALRSPRFGEAAFFCQRMLAQRRFLDGHFDDAELRWKDVFKQAVRAGVAYAEMLRGAQQLELEIEREGPSWVVEKRLRVMTAMQKLTRPARAGIARVAAQAGELDLVRLHLASLGDPSDYPRDGTYLHGMASLSVCAVALEDRARCEQLYGLLSPYANMNTPDAMGYYIGSVSYFLGLLAGALGETAQARGHFEHALEHNRSMGYRAGIVRTCMSHAQLEQRLGRAVRARGLFDQARAQAQALGMRSAALEAAVATERL